MLPPDRRKPAAAEYLQRPARLKCLDSAEEHLNTARNLSRALWLLLHNGEYYSEDERDTQALAELASAIADHASAATVAYYMEHEEANKRHAPA
ncbi:hypothetical protein SAMN06265338_1308 [Rhodoblastus acidophilus]|uniref:Uncharacterized protein n=1 Tax=Rhodoblastus acidophilus TaxID=1074 RepID=A0A212SDV5_RHOAC|nr:hypothetical protein [Rhodoblastus acidophilus]MCW2316768.1 hypothetical protein [Rhodoblastus acidophilus]PPQ34965.1 hypothetical protein CKO16_21380 [Rhodoblastus acidophilus]RAI16809.1 hypothetical protein CH337_19420 [Rhodoblastus acidophilus]SNB83789.1 hypothetical protein SAMN06265338_1308 [Rhodoblastus acidophilus]